MHLGNFIGEFLKYDAKDNAGVWRGFIRIRVKIDVRVPLKKEEKNQEARRGMEGGAF